MAAGCAVTAVVVVGVEAAPAPSARSVTVGTSPAQDQQSVVSSPSPAAQPHHPRLHCRAAARACVDLKRRLAWLQDRSGKVIFGPVRTGISRPGQRTPRGLFRVAWMAPHWVSTEYGLPMPWSVFFAAGGIAFHAGPLNEPSHGCVHLTPTAAHRFFETLAVGDRVDVH